MRALFILALALLLGGCAPLAPDVRVHSSPEADFSRYRSFAFFEPLGTDRSGYSSILSQHLRTFTRQAMEARGYRYNEDQPDLLVNFNARVRDRTEVLSMPHAGYYSYRRGWYGPWGGYDNTVIQYQEGTLNIDLVDARRKQLVWEGVAEGQVTEASRKDIQNTVRTAVEQVFSRYPYRVSR